MPMVELRDMLGHARREGYALASFEVAGLAFAEAALRAAERVRAPVVLAMGDSALEGGVALARAVETAAQQAGVPVALYREGAGSVAAATQAVNGGCNGVMLAVADGRFEDGLALTREAVAMARGCGVMVEGDLRRLPDDGGRDPLPAADGLGEWVGRFVSDTGVDALMLCAEAFRDASGELDAPKLERIGRAAARPLSLAEGSGLSEAELRALPRLGVAKVGFGEVLARAAAGAWRELPPGDPVTALRALERALAEAVGTVAERCLRQCGAAGRAEEALAAATPWRAVEHLIVYNVSGADEARVEAMMAEGRRVLGAIPGVRDVVTGRTVREGTAYRYCWLVRFTHPAVIDSYRDHPDHVAFADNHFRPIAGDRISIDFRHVDGSV